MLAVLTLIASITLVVSFPKFQTHIPNGNHVPNPCHVPPTWNPVGHYNPVHHTRLKNPFALDFRLNGFTWTEVLCKKDSDKDGMTNGEELGDSSCTWQPGNPAPALPIGHPGICEPVGSAMCAYQHFACDCLETCQGLFGQP